MPLTQKLVELQGGELRIDSELDEGTTVIAKFPGDIVVADDVSGDEPARRDTVAALRAELDAWHAEQENEGRRRG